MSATWVIDPKKKKAQSEDGAALPKRVPLDEALETLFVTRARRWIAGEATDDARHVLAFLERFVTDSEARKDKPDEDGIEALWATTRARWIAPPRSRSSSSGVGRSGS